MLKQALRRFCIPANSRLTLTIHAGFFKAYIFSVIAQKAHMLYVNAGDNANVWLDNIYRIQPAAQAYFKYSDINLTLLNKPQGSQGTKFKVCKRYISSCIFYSRKSITVRLLGEHVSVNEYPFTVVNKVRRGETGRAKPRL